MTATATGPRVDRDETIRAVRLIVGDGNVTELRALDATVGSDRWTATWSGYFDDAEKLAKAAAHFRAAKGIYIVPNEIDRALLSRSANRIRKIKRDPLTSDGDIITRRWLLIDCDARRPAGISASEDEHYDAAERARAIRSYMMLAGWADPIVADSGNGAHLMYRVDLPADDGGLVHRCLQALAARFDDDAVQIDTTVHNRARIWKLYGTLACKGDDTPDRPHRMSSIVATPDTVETVPADLLAALASEHVTPANGSTHRGNGHAGNGQPFDVTGFIARHGLDVAGPDPWQGGQRWTFCTSPMCEHGNDGPHIEQHASGAISAGCHHQTCKWTWVDLRTKYEPKPASPGPEPQPRGTTYQRLAPGTLVRAADRDDIGQVVGDDGSMVRVHFVSPSGQSATVSLPRDQVAPIDGSDSPPYQPEFINSAEFATAEYSQRFLVKNILVANQPAIVGGRQKVLKTSVLVDMALSLGSGSDFLGKFSTCQARVAMLSGESGEFTLQETAKRVADARGINFCEADVLWSFRLPQISVAGHLDALGEVLVDNKVEVVILDPAYLSMISGNSGLQASNLFDMGPLLLSLGQMGTDTNTTVILCHHCRKNGADQFSVPELEELSMSGFSEFARQWILLGRREQYEQGSGTHKLWMNVGGSAGHSGRCACATWTVRSRFGGNRCSRTKR